MSITIFILLKYLINKDIYTYYWLIFFINKLLIIFYNTGEEHSLLYYLKNALIKFLSLLLGFLLVNYIYIASKAYLFLLYHNIMAIENWYIMNIKLILLCLIGYTSCLNIF